MIMNLGWNIAIGYCRIMFSKTTLFWTGFYFRSRFRNLLPESNFQGRFGSNVWFGILRRRINDPIIFEGPLTAARYLEYLQKQIEHSFAESKGMYFQQDTAPTRNSRIVTDYFQQAFKENVISTNGPEKWLPSLPDLAPIDFFIWGI